jgi:hypothetical protein
MEPVSTREQAVGILNEAKIASDGNEKVCAFLAN